MSKARNDVGGADRGAKGIDGKKDVGYQLKGVDKTAEKEQYGHSAVALNAKFAGGKY